MGNAAPGRAAHRMGIVIALLASGCGPGPTELVVMLQASRVVHLQTLTLYGSIDGGPELGALELHEGAAPPSLPGSVLLRVPDSARAVTVRAEATSLDGATRKALDTVAIISHGRVTLPLRLEFGDALPDGALALGAPCGVPADCASGFCADGVCCDQACGDGACAACAVATGGIGDGVCSPKRGGALCRPAMGGCDVEERCDGASRACPNDARSDATVVCRPLIGACDKVEFCDGQGADCPADESLCVGATYCAGAMCVPKLASGQACTQDVQCIAGFCTDGFCCDARCQGGACDRCDVATKEGRCTILPSSATCRGATAPCDAAETCDGVSAACPADALAPATKICRAASQICDLAELCTGTSAACPAVDKYQPATQVCRPASATDPCDLAESCTGTSPACPNDVGRQINSQFYRAQGSDGTVRATGLDSTSRVEAACNSTVGPEKRGLLTFSTYGVPSGAIVSYALVRFCIGSGSAGLSPNLYTASYAQLDASAFNSGGALITTLPSYPPGWAYLELPRANVVAGGATQLMVRAPDCTGIVANATYGSSTASASEFNQCPLNIGESLAWTLTVSYCMP